MSAKEPAKINKEMEVTTMTKKVYAVLIGILAVAVAAGGAFVISAQSDKNSNNQDDKVKYSSSVQIPDDPNEKEDADDEEDNDADEKGEADNPDVEDQAETAESARLQPLAKITAEQAKSAALAKFPGTVKKVELEKEDGNVVYGIEIKTADGDRDVKVDAGNGQILHIEKDDGEDDDND